MGVPGKRCHMHIGWEIWKQGSLCWQVLRWHPCNIQYFWVFAYTWIWNRYGLAVCLLSSLSFCIKHSLWKRVCIHLFIIQVFFFSHLHRPWAACLLRNTKQDTIWETEWKYKFSSLLAHAAENQFDLSFKLDLSHGPQTAPLLTSQCWLYHDALINYLLPHYTL